MMKAFHPILRKLTTRSFRTKIRRVLGRLASVQAIEKIREPKVPIWKLRGSPVPPPGKIKQQIVRTYLKDFGLTTLIETGTYRGAMIKAMEPHVLKMYSVELDPKLHKAAAGKFGKNSAVRVVQGDSSELLPRILEEVDGPALFWLDAHYSGGLTAKGDVETPILKELSIVLGRNNSGDVVLIDDAREFNGQGDYPTVDQIKDFVRSVSPGREVSVAMDIIRIVRPRESEETSARRSDLIS